MRQFMRWKRVSPMLVVLVVSSLAAAPAAQTDELISQADWLVGHWRGEGLGGVNDEVWLTAVDGTMLGVYRHLKDGEVVFYELLRLAPSDQTLVLSLKHFRSDLTPWEEPGRWVEFRLKRADANVLEFDGITYRKIGPDELEIVVTLGAKNDLRRERFSYRRVDP